jgi:DNA-binding NarL/FixJ family response regulator
MTRTRVLLVDDHAVIRDGLRTLLEQKLLCEVVGECSDGRSAVSTAVALRPDLVLIDINMPEMNGIEATRAITRELPDTRVIALTMHRDKRYAIEMITAGAFAYILKDATFDEVATAVRAVLANQRYMSPAVGADALRECLDRLASPAERPRSSLTPKEREILQLITEGRSSREIADALVISAKTVDNHRQRIMEKLDLHTVAELTKYAIREGITSLDA